MSGDPTDSAEVPCLWLFLPLPHPLGLPPGWRAQRRLSATERLAMSGPVLGFSSSISIHQIVPSRQPVIADLVDLSLLAGQAMSQFGVDRTPATSGRQPLRRFRQWIAERHGPPSPLAELKEVMDLPALEAVRTIAEVVVPSSDEDERVSAALDEAIDHIRHVQRAVAVAAELPVRLISRATLPPIVPIFSGVLRIPVEGEAPQPPRVRGPVTHRIVGCAPPSALGLRPEPFGETALDGVEMAADNIARLGPFEVYADLRREAMGQRHFEGNRRLALVSLATAGEVLLDTMLLMLWEEHVSPEIAATHFDRSEGHTNRVARRFPGRLGGGWDTGSTSAAGRYLRDLVRLRHRVVHAGHEPKEEELQAAWKALFDLEHYLADLLASERNLNRYTRTAIAWMGNRGLERRGRWTRHVERLAHDKAEPDWVDSFARYRAVIDRALLPEPDRQWSEPTDLVLIADRTDEHGTRWVIHDEVAMQAAIVPAASVRDDEARSRVDELLDLAAGGPPPHRVGMLLGCPPPEPLHWQADYEVFCDLAIFPATRTPT